MMDRDGVIGVSFHRPADDDTFIKRISRVPTLRTRPLKRPSTLYRECRLFENEIFFTICRRSARARARTCIISSAARQKDIRSGRMENIEKYHSTGVSRRNNACNNIHSTPITR